MKIDPNCRCSELEQSECLSCLELVTKICDEMVKEGKLVKIIKDGQPAYKHIMFVQ